MKEGFNSAEAKFLKDVPHLLEVTQGNMEYVTWLYNREMNTDISKDEFKARLDDFVSEDVPKAVGRNETVEKFLKDYDFGECNGPLFRLKIRKILEDYDSFKNKELLKKFDGMFSEFDSNMKSFENLSNRIFKNFNQNQWSWAKPWFITC